MNANLYWFTGLSGAGKTTIATMFYEKVKTNKNNIIFLDGDNLREILADDQQYSLKMRKKLAIRYSKLCKMLIEQGNDVVIATISMFQDIRDWNRANIKNYHEIYIEAPIDVLIKRDQKKLYSRALKGQIDNVLGMDVEFEVPKDPDIVILNDGSETPINIANFIVSQVK